MPVQAGVRRARLPGVGMHLPSAGQQAVQQALADLAATAEHQRDARWRDGRRRSGGSGERIGHRHRIVRAPPFAAGITRHPHAARHATAGGGGQGDAWRGHTYTQPPTIAKRTGDLVRAARISTRMESDAQCAAERAHPRRCLRRTQSARRMARMACGASRSASVRSLPSPPALASASPAHRYAVGMTVHAFRSRAGHRRDAPVTLGLLLANLVFPA
ncbi:hypothetical protein NB706_002342 [Xanthomonas sacchari]|nr:hypothetical protein [Xanthomonas sacchari]